ncbi:PREDICTED: 60S ribosomal protein L18a-2-like [Lupinus angustifolius]|uniref:60S ribosomal protein L18a-2-like n=1 Tax=Lupinus angustifolius TaxID=3871 RepID=UPI00092F49AC|nr:PREDICTED: 60S ribosomal protein L18a-2-like [Lupinus angustifolius]
MATKQQPYHYPTYNNSNALFNNEINSVQQQLNLKLQIFEKNPTKIKNYGIWLRYQSRTGYHNMYKEYRDTTLNGAVEAMYNEMASRHRVRFPCIQIIKTATIAAKLCKRESTKQFHNSKIKFPLVYKKIRPPTRKLKTTYKAKKPNLFM